MKIRGQSKRGVSEKTTAMVPLVCVVYGGTYGKKGKNEFVGEGLSRQHEEK